MAEETPDFGGWTAGRAANDNRGLDRATDRLEAEINRFADAIEKLTASAGGAASGGGGGQQSSSPNGGGATFGGVPGGAHSAAGGAHRGQGMFAQAGSTIGAAMPFTQTGGAHATTSHRGQGFISRNQGNIAKGAAGAAVAAGAVFTANHYSSQMTGQTLASMYAGNGDWQGAFRSGYTGNYTAHNTQDAQAMTTILGQRGGSPMGSSTWNQQRSAVMSYSAVNPTISNAQGAGAAVSLGSTTSFNRLSRVGINPLGAGGAGDPRSVARQIRAKMGGRVTSREQALAAFGPSGSATVTLDSFASAGYIPADAVPVIESELRNILLAEARGVSAKEYASMATKANTSETARKSLESMGIAANTLIQGQRGTEGRRRDAEGETIGGFTSGVRGATSAINKFRDALNGILGLPGVGEVTGLFSGLSGTTPLVGNILGKVPGGGQISGLFSALGGGDGPSSMSAGQMSYGGASGAGAATAGFGSMGGTNMRPAAGTASSGSSAPAGNRYSLGPVKPWVAKAASILGPKFGISTIGGVAARSTPSDHPKGLALDFMCGKSAGDGLAAYAVQNHKALNITYVIWRQRIWSINNPRWTGMEDRGDPTANHFDHVHVSFLASPTNGDFTGLPSGGAGGSLGMGKGKANLGQGASSPDNGAAGAFTTGGGGVSGFSEVAALGITAGGAGGGIGGMSAGGSSGSGSRGRGGSGGMGRISGGYGSGAAGTVRSGTYNVGSLKGRTNPAADLEKLIGPADVLALTEVNPSRLAAIRRGLADDNWGVYAGDGSASGSYALDASIAYDKDKYKLVKGGTYKLGDQTGDFLGGRGKRFANYALLQDKESGMSFWQVAAHTVPMANADMKHRRMHKEQFDSLDNLAAMLKKTGIPVIMGGDFNQQRDRDFWRNPGGMSSARGGGVDHVFGQTGAVKTTNLSMIGGLSGDHSGAVLATMSIKGTDGGGGRKAGNGGTPAQNMALGRAMAAARGWSGSQWEDLKTLWQHESGWRTDADNPTSSAYGIPQALTELHNLGNKYKTDPKAQINWGLNYIAGRYGSPSKAWDFWQKNNWYDVGEWNIRDDKDARVHKGEMVVPTKIADVVREELAAPGINDALGRRRAGGGGGATQVIFQSGAITVSMPGGASRQQSEQAGRWLVDAMMEDARFKALTEGG